MGQLLPSESPWVFAKIHIARPRSTPTESEVGREVGRTWLFFFFFCADAFENALLPTPRSYSKLTSPRLTFQAKSGISSRDWKVPQLWFQLSP